MTVQGPCDWSVSGRSERSHIQHRYRGKSHFYSKHLTVCSTTLNSWNQQVIPVHLTWLISFSKQMKLENMCVSVKSELALFIKCTLLYSSMMISVISFDANYLPILQTPISHWLEWKINQGINSQKLMAFIVINACTEENQNVSGLRISVIF